MVILWSRMGTALDPATYGYKDNGEPYWSGTEREYWDAYRAARATGSPLLVIYRRTEEVLVSNRDPQRKEKLGQSDRVEAFFAAFTSPEGYILQSYKSYEKPDNFGRFLKKI